MISVRGTNLVIHHECLGEEDHESMQGKTTTLAEQWNDTCHTYTHSSPTKRLWNLGPFLIDCDEGKRWRHISSMSQGSEAFPVSCDYDPSEHGHRNQ